MNALKLSQDRPFKAIPRSLLIILMVSFCLQLGWHAYSARHHVERAFLSQPPSDQQLKVIALGEEEVLARILMLWLQSFDNQPGVSVPLRELNYHRIVAWLEKISRLDQRSHYPLSSAAYIYAGIKEPQRQRLVFDFIEARFKEQPKRYWRWLAHASIMARHRLKDNALALKYARMLREYTLASDIPGWARQMEITILEENGEYESARMLIGGLLNESLLNDPQEQYYLNQRLQTLKGGD